MARKDTHPPRTCTAVDTYSRERGGDTRSAALHLDSFHGGDRKSLRHVTQEGMSYPYVVAFSGYMNAGKSTCRDYLRSSLFQQGFVCDSFSFAEPLKEIVKVMFDFSDDDVYERECKEKQNDFWGFSPREALQKVGTEIMRNTLPQVLPSPQYATRSFWIAMCDRRLQKLKEQGIQVVLIDDVRFPDEADFIQSVGGTVIRVCRPGLGPGSQHESEQGQSRIFPTHTLQNDSGHLLGLWEKISSAHWQQVEGVLPTELLKSGRK